MIKKFKEFALKGNVLDLAIGVVIGGAFGKIVSSLVNDVIMPILGLLLGGMNFSNLKLLIGSKNNVPLYLNYGTFIQSVIDFLIISFSIFMFIKLISSFKKKDEIKEVQEQIPEPTKEELLLAEIRDLLKEQNKTSNEA